MPVDLERLNALLSAEEKTRHNPAMKPVHTYLTRKLDEFNGPAEEDETKYQKTQEAKAVAEAAKQKKGKK